jgi:hypothetical protein
MLNPEEVRSWDYATMLFLQLPSYAISPAALMRLRSRAAFFMRDENLKQLMKNDTLTETTPTTLSEPTA